MDHGDVLKRPSAPRNFDVPRDLPLRHLGIMLKDQRLQPVVVPDIARKGRDGADISVRPAEPLYLRARIEVLVLNADHPPVTGGKNATSSVAATRASNPTWI